MSEITSGHQIIQPKSIGQEFIEWAEEFWHLKDLIQIGNPDEFAEEKCDYNYMRNIFIKKINGLIQDKLGLL